MGASSNPSAVTVSLSGLASPGEVLTATATSTDAAYVYTYQWQYSADGLFDHPVDVGSNSATYQVTDDELGGALRVVVTATDTVANVIKMVTSYAPGAVADFVWTNASGGDWSSPANWSLGVVPDADDSVMIDLPVTVTATNQSVASLQIGAGASLSLNGQFTAGGTSSNQGAITSYGTLNLSGALANSGLVLVQAGGNCGSATLAIGSAGLELSGGGTLQLSDASACGGSLYVVSQGADSTLENVDDVIEGLGQVGDQYLSVLNDVSGIIDADWAGRTLTLAPCGLFDNHGLAEATSNGTLVIGGNGVAWINEAGATISADDATLDLHRSVPESRPHPGDRLGGERLRRLFARRSRRLFLFADRRRRAGRRLARLCLDVEPFRRARPRQCRRLGLARLSRRRRDI